MTLNWLQFAKKITHFIAQCIFMDSAQFDRQCCGDEIVN